jgi:diketogulonate reductase-like aldo/keto reductase
LETAFYLGFSKLKKITNVVLQIHFHCGDTEAELMKYKEKWGIGDKDQCPLTRHKIKMENEQLFKMLKEK